jgi:hypothetical protein
VKQDELVKRLDILTDSINREVSSNIINETVDILLKRHKGDPISEAEQERLNSFNTPVTKFLKSFFAKIGN